MNYCQSILNILSFCKMIAFMHLQWRRVSNLAPKLELRKRFYFDAQEPPAKCIFVLSIGITSLIKPTQFASLSSIMPEGPELHLAARLVTEVSKGVTFGGAIVKSAVSTKVKRHLCRTRDSGPKFLNLTAHLLVYTLLESCCEFHVR